MESNVTSQTVLPKGAVVKVRGIPYELLEDATVAGEAADEREAAQNGPAPSAQKGQS